MLYINTKFVYIEHMKNVTISISESLEKFARLLAAEHSKSLSRFIADLLDELKTRTTKREHAMQEYFSEKPYIETAGKKFLREDIYDRKVLR